MKCWTRTDGVLDAILRSFGRYSAVDRSLRGLETRQEREDDGPFAGY